MKSAKEWLKEEGLENYDTIERIPPYKEEGPNFITGAAYSLEVLMGRFANYRTRELQAKILEFRMELFKLYQVEKIDALHVVTQRDDQHINQLINTVINIIEANDIPGWYDKYFGITEARNGEV